MGFGGMAIQGAIFLCVILISLQVTTAVRCNSCADRCLKCEYGYTYSKMCEFNVCYKGPGESCSYVDVQDHICSEGLYCKNGKCQGCIIFPFKCFTESLPVVKKLYT